MQGNVKLKVLEVGASGTTFLGSYRDDYDRAGKPWTLAEAEREGWSLEGEAEKWKPEMNTRYLIPCVHSDAFFIYYTWLNNLSDQRYLSRGLICRTKEEAIAMAQKMLDAVK